ncbi:MAG: radical SAM protein [Oligoflexia bacterium]|nr:radical SAM protein [Oligoflexia bacterium]
MKNVDRYLDAKIGHPNISYVNSRKSIDKVFYMPIGRGCLNQCSYCGGSTYLWSNHWGNKNISFRDKNVVLEDIEKVYQRGVQCIYFEFDPYPDSEKYYLQLFRKIRERKIKVGANFVSWCPPSKKFVEEFAITFIQDFSAITISIDSASEKIRKINKNWNYSNQQLLDNFKLLSHNNVYFFVSFSIGLPFETIEDIYLTEKMIKYLLNTFQCHCNVSAIPIEPSSMMYYYPKEMGVTLYRNSFDDFYDFSKNISEGIYPKHPLGYSTNVLEEKEIIAFKMKSFKKNFLNLKFLKKKVLQSNNKISSYNLCERMKIFYAVIFNSPKILWKNTYL